MERSREGRARPRSGRAARATGRAGEGGYLMSFLEIFADEVVTRAHVRDVELPYGAVSMLLISLDNGFDHTKPNSFGPGGLTALNTALDSVAARDDLVAVGVTGKPFIFAVGADLGGVPRVPGRAEAHEIARLGHG